MLVYCGLLPIVIVTVAAWIYTALPGDAGAVGWIARGGIALLALVVVVGLLLERLFPDPQAEPGDGGSAPSEDHAVAPPESRAAIRAPRPVR